MSSGVTSINELPSSNLQNNNIQQQMLMQQQPQNIILNRSETISQSNTQMPGLGQLIPSGGYSMQNPIMQNPQIQQIQQNQQVTLETPRNMQPNYNELINQIQKAAANGTTGLPSRDIPIDPVNVANDTQTQPNYIPPPQIQEDYIRNNETPQHLIDENAKMVKNMNNYDVLFQELQLPIIIALLYFLFQLPAIKKYSKGLLPFLFKDDGNPNIYGYVANSVMFASMVYVLLKAVSKLA